MTDQPDQSTIGNRPRAVRHPPLSIALLTGGSDKPYALGMAAALTSVGISVDFLGSDELDVAELHSLRQLRFLNLRGDQSPDVSLATKISRIATYYWRLIAYAATARPLIFHILWNNKFEVVDRILLMAYYRLLGKKIVLTAHNVNIRKRDNCDSFLNRASLCVQYQLSDHILVHTDRMKRELVVDFAIPENKVSVIPFGINRTSPVTAMGTHEAKGRLGIRDDDKTMLFFGQIAAYKGVEYLVAAFVELAKRDETYRLVIAGKVKKGQSQYWNAIQRKIATSEVRHRITERIEYIPDDEVELFFKGADVLILPYLRIFQSGIPFLAYNFGLPVIATDVGSLREDIIDGRTGFVSRPEDASDLARVIGQYFESELFRNLETRRAEIKNYADERYSWDKVAATSKALYSFLMSNVPVTSMARRGLMPARSPAVTTRRVGGAG